MTDSLLRVAFILLLCLPFAAFLPAPHSKTVSLWGSAAASALVLAVAVQVVSSGSVLTLSLWSTAPYAQLVLRLDATGAVFAVIIAGVGVSASVFGVAYAHARRPDEFVYPLFLLAMLTVVAAGNVYTFLVAWEGMALASFVLVLGEGAARPQRQAAILYLVMTHVATVLVAAAFFIVAQHSGTTTFDAMSGSGLSGPLASIAFLCALVGFGTKAGLVPLHVWLPRAHPVAPSHVSALMSSAMVMTGVYGIIRVGMVFLGPGEVWWGLLLMFTGCLSAVLGVLYALMEQDLKRILAYSTVENVGIVCVALGAAIALRAQGSVVLAGTMLLAALLHAMNHAWFKTLLFLAAGSLQRATGTLNIDLAGGLARRKPVTSAAVLVGSLAIAGLPPLNGFAGEWLLLRGLAGIGASDAGDVTRLASLGAIGALSLTAGLAVACFVRMYGIAFLGLPRSARVAAATESSSLMYGVLCVLALGCLTTGLATPWLAQWLGSVVRELALPAAAGVQDQHQLVLGSGGSFSPALIAGALLLLAPLPWLAARAAYGRNRRSSVPVWSTGVVFRPSMQYTATSLAKPVRWFFQRLLLPERKVDVVYHGSSPFPRLVSYSGRVPALWEERLYLPARSVALWASQRLRLLQSGSVQLYLLYMMVALMLLVFVAR